MEARNPRPLAAAALLALAAVSACGLAQGQAVYRIVGPDGRVTFSDQPPLQPAAQAPAVAGRAAPAAGPPSAATGTGAAGAGGALPYELRQASTRYPVTLYIAPGCAPCQSGRALLLSRGVPFAERTVTSNEDIEALRRMAGAATVPLLTVGAQQVKGFSETEWSQYIDAAGYPRSSQLPRGWQPAPSRPLVEVQPRPAQAAPEPEPAPPAPFAAPSQPSPPGLPPEQANPAGIRF